MDINAVHRYSHLGGKLLHLTYGALGVKVTGTLLVFYVYVISKAKSHPVRKDTYTRVSKLVESIFVDTTDPFPESCIGNRYWIGVVD